MPCRTVLSDPIHLLERFEGAFRARRFRTQEEGTVEEAIDQPDDAGDNVTEGRREETDRLIVEALAMRQTQAAAAQAAGVTPRTVGRRLTDPRFVARVRQRQVEIAEEDLGRLGELRRSQVLGAQLATKKLIELLDDDNPHIALGAARALSSTRAQPLADISPVALGADGAGWSL
jgi:hypothetical protein